MDMIALEQTLIPKLLPTSQQRAENLIALLQSKGSTVAARSHCNIDPVSGLKSLEHLRARWKTTGRISAVKSSPSRSTACCTPGSMR